MSELKKKLAGAKTIYCELLRYDSDKYLPIVLEALEEFINSLKGRIDKEEDLDDQLRIDIANDLEEDLDKN